MAVLLDSPTSGLESRMVRALVTTVSKLERSVSASDTSMCVCMRVCVC